MYVDMLVGTPQVPPCEKATFLRTVKAQESREGWAMDELWPQAGKLKQLSNYQALWISPEAQWWSLFYTGKLKFKL